MNKSLGLASLLIAVIAIFIPIITLYAVWLSLTLAIMSGLMKNVTFPIASALVNMVNIIFLSPMTWAVLKGENLGGDNFLMVVTVTLFIGSIVSGIYGVVKAQGKDIK